MSVYPKWMERRYNKIIIEIPVSGGGSGGGGVSLLKVEKKIPKVVVKKFIVIDNYENINITVRQVIDLSLNGGT